MVQLKVSIIMIAAIGDSATAKAQLEKLVAKNYYLHKSARDAYRSYLHSYNSHGLKDVYDVARRETSWPARV